MRRLTLTITVETDAPLLDVCTATCVLLLRDGVSVADCRVMAERVVEIEAVEERRKRVPR